MVDNKIQTGTEVFHDRGPYHRYGTIPIICRANQWTGFYMTGTSVTKELSLVKPRINIK